jgi:mono/diheme cytochrome c family protein
MLRKSILVVTALAGVSAAIALQPGEPFKPGKLPPAEVAALQPGLTLRFYAKADDKTALDTRRVRLAALHVPANSEPTPFLAPGPFHAKLTGYIKTPLKGTYGFRLHGNTPVTLKINDKSVLTLPTDKDKSVEVELAKNYNKVEILCASAAKGDTTMRLYWSGEKFDFEPVPPDVLSSRGDDADLVAQSALREGRELFANRHCASCHALPGSIALKDCKMPEFQSNAASLDNAGHRFGYDWLVAWIMNPQALRPEATMPSVVAAEKDAHDIATYLMSLKESSLPNLGKKVSADAGAANFKKLGCNACHRMNEPKEKDELGRLTLYHAAGKYQPGAIGHFLKSPQQRRAWTRMPDFKLSDDEAASLEAYLRQESKGKPPLQAKGDASRGAKLFASAGCQNCHQVGAEKNVERIAKFQSLDKGCLAEKDRGKAPDFRLTDSERSALSAFLKSGGESLTRETPAEFSLRQVKALQCASCHRRDGESTRWHAVLEDEGKVPENLPSLTWIGEKLHPAWAKKMLAGEHDHRARPWLKARMPAFPARADMLAVGLSHEHGFAVDEDDKPAPDTKLAAVGEKLVPQQGGFHCSNCHGIGSVPAKEPFEAPGINLLDASVRLRYHYYRRWMMTPDRVDVTMRMPIFSSDGKTTQLRDVFDGDARQQYDALWHYIQTLPAKK